MPDVTANMDKAEKDAVNRYFEELERKYFVPLAPLPPPGTYVPGPGFDEEIVCKVCGSVVPREYRFTHSTWHEGAALSERRRDQH